MASYIQVAAFCCLAFSVLSPALAQETIRPPKITATVDLPKKPTKVDGASTGPFLNGSEAPERVISEEDKKKLKSLAATYAQVARDNYALIIHALHQEAHASSKPVQIVVTYAYNGVAATSGAGFGSKATGARIEVSATYALAHPSDLGMIVHEMVHVVQSYPTYDPVWLVEGIADYVRWFNYEPAPKRPHPNPQHSTARDSYRTTGAFLDWATNKYDKNLVPELNAAFQANAYNEGLWKQYTGKTLDELNTEWIESLKAG